MTLTKNDLLLIKEIINGSFDDPRNSLRVEMLEFKLEILSEIQKLRDDVAVVVGYRDIIEQNKIKVNKLVKIHPSYKHA